MRIPDKFEQILKNDQKLHGVILQIVTDFEPILKDNKLYFFEEYTDHGIEHIESVLHVAAEIITDDTYPFLSSKDVGVLILSIILHDLGMHIEYSSFRAFLDGQYDDVQNKALDGKTWTELWEEYLTEAKRFSSKQRLLYFGNENQPFKEPDLTNKDNLDGVDKKLIGEFLRRFHTRFAHEVALKGLIGKNGKTIEFGGSRLNKLYKQLAGLIARSHGMNIRDTFPYLEEISSEAWKAPDQINVVFLMVVLRIADYFQFHKERVDSMLLKLKTFNSPVSQFEHEKHLAIEYVQPHPDDLERLFVIANPSSSRLFVKIYDLIKDIQHELDISWAVLGEIYSRFPQERRPAIRYRRITSNLDDKIFVNKLPYVADRISFQADVELPKLLIAPLYGSMPTFGVRELIQNSVDACLEREFDEKKNNMAYVPEINVYVNKLSDETYEFVIQDNGKGMSLYEIKNFFLRVGSSFRKSLEWQKHYTDNEGSSLINRNGRFGIGILAAFLLGEVIEVRTKHFKESIGYSFRTTVDTEQIEIKLDREIANSGTTIIVRTPQNLGKLLQDNASTVNRGNHIPSSNSPKWTHWYRLRSPKISYILFGKKIDDIEFIDPSEWHTIKPHEFNSISWKYDPKRHFYDPDLICNGILVPDSPWQISPPDGSVVRHTPSLVITDNEGNLPLTLDRNKLDGNFTFIEELIADVSKDFIAYILCSDIDPKKEIIKLGIQRSRLAEIFFLRDGFTLNIDYFIKELNKKGYSFLRFVTQFHKLPFTPEYLDSTYILIPVTQEEIKLSYAEDQIKPRSGGRVSVTTDKYQLLFDKDKRRLSQRFKRLHKVENKEKDIVVFTYEYDAPQSRFFKRLLKEQSSYAQSIQDINYKGGSTAGKVLGALLKRYFRDSVIIPYDLAKRKKLYSQAFDELAKYIRPYQKIS